MFKIILLKTVLLKWFKKSLKISISNIKSALFFIGQMVINHELKKKLKNTECQLPMHP